MTQVSAKRKSQHCKACGHNVFVSYDGMIYQCERCHPAAKGATVRQTGLMNPKITADQVLARARHRGGSGEGELSMIDYLIHQRGSELDAERIEALKRARKLGEEHDLERRTQ